MEKKFEKFTASKRLGSMLAVDLRRMFTMPLLYILVGAAILIPILILVMTTMMDGSVSVDPNTGAETVIEAFDHAWQIIGSTSAASSSGEMGMDLVSMCNINLLYFLIAVFVSIFVSEDFRSGYCKNLFTVRSKKTDYVISKTVSGWVAGGLMILGFFGGTLIGGAAAGLPFTMEGFNTANLIMCILGKLLLVGIFAAIYVLMSIIGKQKLWLSMLLSLCTGMFLFNIAPMVTPLDSGVMQVILCAAGSILFALGLGTVSKTVLGKRDIL